MLPSRSQLATPHDLSRTSGQEGWHRIQVRSIAETTPVLETICTSMVGAGYTDRDVFGMRLALEEALVNAIKYGHKGDATKSVRVGYRVLTAHVLIEVADEGDGFDPHRVDDPLAPENLDRPSGRGLLLMRRYTSWVRYNSRGNAVVLCRYRSSSAPQPSENEAERPDRPEEKLQMHDPVKVRARYLAYAWYRTKHPAASHQRAWKFSGRYWKAFLLKALEGQRRKRSSSRSG